MPAGAEAVDPTLLTTSQLQTGRLHIAGPRERPGLVREPRRTARRPRRAVRRLRAGRDVYRYQYTVQLTTRGVFHALPAHASETYFPEVFGHGAGEFFTVR